MASGWPLYPGYGYQEAYYQLCWTTGEQIWRKVLRRFNLRSASSVEGVPRDPLSDLPVQNDAMRAGAARTDIFCLDAVDVDEALFESCGQCVECSICMDSIQGPSSAKRLPCQHLFHSDRLISWLTVRNTCPLCRRILKMEVR
ncbi:hypothetical protein KP509_01G022800 [Ceratopteris richardii]|uniref:RING-type domain-containing protein n=1 Tax=Ceratopteris richardii TaxID=49495 RepID=A0A8T2VFA3_CERRI|nr:hypothetical protein KP509_01G022800 [Ceratopteris richardii]